MERIIIKDVSELENSHLGPAIKEHIENAIKKKYVGLCQEVKYLY